MSGDTILKVSEAKSPLQDDVLCLGCGRLVGNGEPIVKGFCGNGSSFICFECWEWLTNEFMDWCER